MDRKIGKLLALAAVEVLLLGMLAGNSGQASREPERSVELSGSIRILGSTSMEKLTDALAECFMERHPDVAVTVQFAGSSAGIAAVARGGADLGISSRNLKEEERAEGVTENIVAIDGIAICVDSGNSVSGLDMGQLADIYMGKIANWREVGGANMPIVVVGREAGSGTREAFEELLGIKDHCTYANELDGMGTVLARVSATPGAIGYVSFDVIKDGEDEEGAENFHRVLALSIDGVEPTAENVKAGSYPLCRPFMMITKGEMADQGKLLQEWFAFVYSGEGQELVARAGLIPID